MNHMFHGFDMDRTMLRIGAMNMMNHRVESPFIEYRDSGAGLSPDIHNPNDIFKPFFTTRRNPSTGEEVGTGLGMWIVKSVLEENDAGAVILNHDDGFGIRFMFPIKYTR